MKSLLAFVILLVCAVFAVGQSYEPKIVEQDIQVKDWTYKNVSTSTNVNLRQFTKDKKLVMVAYVSPECENWEGDVTSLKFLYKHYHSKGLEVIAIVENPSISTIRTDLSSRKIKFPVVYRPAGSGEAQNPFHHRCIASTDTVSEMDSPWGIFLTPETFEKDGDTLTKNSFVISGGLGINGVEDHVRKQLGLKPLSTSNKINPILAPLLWILCIFCQ